MEIVAFLTITKKSVSLVHTSVWEKANNDEIVSIPTATQDDVKQQLLIGHFYISKAR